MKRGRFFNHTSVLKKRPLSVPFDQVAGTCLNGFSAGKNPVSPPGASIEKGRFSKGF